MKQYTKRKHIAFLRLSIPFCSCLLFPSQAFSNVIYAGYSQNEVNSVLGPLDIDFEPAGLNVVASFTLNDNWSLGIDLGQQDDSVLVANAITAEYDSDNWGVNINYFANNWAFSYSFANWSDELNASLPFRNNPLDPPIQTQSNDSPSHSVRATRYFTGANWQVGLSGGLHYNNWEQDTVAIMLPEQDVIISAHESGDSTFLSVGVDGAWFVPVSDSRDLILGVSINWNEHLSDEVDGISINSRNANQIGNRNLINNLNGLTVSGSESYGQATLYASLDLTEKWILDISTGFDIALDNNTQYWNINLGYLF